MDARCPYCGEIISPPSGTARFCCEDCAVRFEAEKNAMRDSWFRLLQSIMRTKKPAYGLIGKLLTPVCMENGMRKTLTWLEDNKEYLERSLINKNITAPYNQAAYLAAILKNRLPKYDYRKEMPVKKSITVTDGAGLAENYRGGNRRRGLKAAIKGIQ